MSLSIEDAARIMGMKPHREVRQATPVDGGTVALTHDGGRTLIRDDGSMEFNLPALSVVVDDETEAKLARIEADLDQLGELLDEQDDDGEPDGDGLDAALAGNAAGVLAWVDGDAGRATRAIEAEQSREAPPPRSTLIADLRKVLKAAESG
jgi:hypothetical protein